jgi:hypothetical protein
MPVLVARDAATGAMAWCPLNEGSGEVLRYGADGPAVVEGCAGCATCSAGRCTPR